MEIIKALTLRFGHLMLNILGIIRRAFCCFRRRRRASDVGLPISSNDIKHSSLNSNSVPELQNWDSWNENEAPLSILIDQKNTCVNRNASSQRSDRNSLSEEVQDDLYDDLFKELTPAITKTKKYVIKKTTTDDQRMTDLSSSRLAVDLKASLLQSGSELGVIEDNVETWEDVAANEDLWDSDQILKAQKQEEREKRLAEHQRRKLEKETQRIEKPDNTPIAMKLS